MYKQSELMVITKAKALVSYILTVTQKSPKQFRFSLVAKMQNYAMDIVETLYKANEVFIAGANRNLQKEKRLDLQHQALTNVKVLGYLAQLSMEQACSLPKQFPHIAKLLSDTQNLIGAWINSDKKRFSPNGV